MQVADSSMFRRSQHSVANLFCSHFGQLAQGQPIALASPWSRSAATKPTYHWRRGLNGRQGDCDCYAQGDYHIDKQEYRYHAPLLGEITMAELKLRNGHALVVAGGKAGGLTSLMPPVASP